jgi:hypothetical protein
VSPIFVYDTDEAEKKEEDRQVKVRKQAMREW